MSTKELQELKNTIPPYSDYATWTDEQKRLDKRISCIEMINSCLIYGYGLDYYLEDYKKQIGEEEVNQLIEEQKGYFHNHVNIHHGVYTDGDGCSYNSIEEY